MQAQPTTQEVQSQWETTEVFEGFQTKLDASKIGNGANPNGQNTSVNEGDRISIRPLGYDLFPTTATYDTTSGNPVTSIHTFRKRDGSNIMIRVSGTTMEWYCAANGTWEILETGLTAGTLWGFADYNINTDLVSYTYYGNGVDNFRRWTGNITNLTSALVGGETKIPVVSTAGFSDTGAVTINGVVVSYSTLTQQSGTANVAVTTTNTTLVDTRLTMTVNAYIGSTITCNGKTLVVTANDATSFTGVSWSGGSNPGNGNAWSLQTTNFFTVVSAPAAPNNAGVADQIYSNSSLPKGNIYMVAQNRLFIAGVLATPQAIYASKYGDAITYLTTLVTSTTAADACIFNLGEGGGAVTGMAQDEGALYFFKRSIIYKAVLSDSLYTLESLKTFDGRSQTIGAINQRSIFAGGNGIFFVTPDNQIMFLTRVEQVDYPQIQPISDIIKPTVDSVDFSSATGIVYKDKAYLAVKSTVDSSINDTILIWNIKNSFWDSPVVGFNVADWCVYQDSSTKNLDSLFFGDNTNDNVFQTTSTAMDYIYGVTANYRTKQNTYGAPHSLKECDDLYIDGYISPSTSLTISLLLDEDGFTQVYTTTILGTETDYIFNAGSFNLFGFSPFGTMRFGSNADQTGKKRFRVYLNKDFKMVPFYTAQLEFASEGDSQAWEIITHALKVKISTQPERTKLLRKFQ